MAAGALDGAESGSPQDRRGVGRSWHGELPAVLVDADQRRAPSTPGTFSLSARQELRPDFERGESWRLPACSAAPLQPWKQPPPRSASAVKAGAIGDARLGKPSYWCTHGCGFGRYGRSARPVSRDSRCAGTAGLHVTLQAQDGSASRFERVVPLPPAASPRRVFEFKTWSQLPGSAAR
eukprot:TRINITY_DN74567_c0_g1_i1.p1 TRINITY_DN74567_c0_g1~~TRINITY_DN74567_c0_g1_i1.p1  ORF type:complete len:179 (+),score=26.91 TRINITY_DN74567_c0_g1_i1:29-565(+)